MRIVEETETGLTVETSTKLNVFLEVLGKRDDGFHELESLFVELERPSDRIRVERLQQPAGGLLFSTTHATLADDPTNLCIRAARRFLDGMDPKVDECIQVFLDKRVPMGSGIAGGSADGAAVLIALARLFPERGMPRERGAAMCDSPLFAWAAELGSDVPFFLVGGTAHVRGRGERVDAWKGTFPGAFVLALPPVHCATPAVFRRLAHGEPSPRRSLQPLLDALAANDVGDLSEHFWNRLQAPCFDLHPTLVTLRDGLQTAWGRRVHLSGSGATLFAWFEDRERADRALAQVEGRFQDVRFLTSWARTAEERS